MAVAETSRSSGKSSASGATRSTRSQRTRCPRRVEIQASNWPLVPVEIAQVATNSLAIATVKASNVLAAALQAGYDAYKSMSRGTNVQAKDIVIQATQGDITATAAKLQTDNITLDAAKNVNLIAAANLETNTSSNSSNSVGVASPLVWAKTAASASSCGQHRRRGVPTAQRPPLITPRSPSVATDSPRNVSQKKWK